VQAVATVIGEADLVSGWVTEDCTFAVCKKLSTLEILMKF
jgi:hypothetical protein